MLSCNIMYIGIVLSTIITWNKAMSVQRKAFIVWICEYVAIGMGTISWDSS